MTGPEHYREAERLLKVAEHELVDYAQERNDRLAALNLQQAAASHQRAQVHATLAQAAATLDVQLNEHLLAAWAEALS